MRCRKSCSEPDVRAWGSPTRMRYRWEGVHLRLADGDRVRGHKVDLTARVMQQQFGVAQPDFGRLLASMIDLQGEPLPVDRLIEPEVEPEVAFMLARERPGGRWPTYWRRRAMRRCLRHEHHR